MATRRDGAQKAAKVPVGDSNQRYLVLQLSAIFIKEIFLIRVSVDFKIFYAVDVSKAVD